MSTFYSPGQPIVKNNRQTQTMRAYLEKLNELTASVHAQVEEEKKSQKPREIDERILENVLCEELKNFRIADDFSGENQNVPVPNINESVIMKKSLDERDTDAPIRTELRFFFEGTLSEFHENPSSTKCTLDPGSLKSFEGVFFLESLHLTGYCNPYPFDVSFGFPHVTVNTETISPYPPERNLHCILPCDAPTFTKRKICLIKDQKRKVKEILIILNKFTKPEILQSLSNFDQKEEILERGQQMGQSDFKILKERMQTMYDRGFCYVKKGSPIHIYAQYVMGSPTKPECETPTGFFLQDEFELKYRKNILKYAEDLKTAITNDPLLKMHCLSGCVERSDGKKWIEFPKSFSCEEAAYYKNNAQRITASFSCVIVPVTNEKPESNVEKK